MSPTEFRPRFKTKGDEACRSSILAFHLPRANIRNATQVDREHWDGYWYTLVETGNAKLTDREEFDRQFTNTSRQTASPRPGIRCTFVWPLEESERLDDRRSQLKTSVKGRINQLLDGIGEENSLRRRDTLVAAQLRALTAR